jgi:Na+-driven multidrug efflux pump
MITIILAVYLTVVGNGLTPIIMMVPLVMTHIALSYFLYTAYGINGLAMASNITYFVALLGLIVFTIVSKDE